MPIQSSTLRLAKTRKSVTENKKIISGKINNALSNDSHLYRGGVENRNIIYWPPVILYTGSFEPNHATDLLHETVDFKKTSRTSQPCWCTTSKQLWPKATQFFTPFGLV